MAHAWSDALRGLPARAIARVFRIMAAPSAVGIRNGTNHIMTCQGRLFARNLGRHRMSLLLMTFRRYTLLTLLLMVSRSAAVAAQDQLEGTRGRIIERGNNSSASPTSCRAFGPGEQHQIPPP